MILVISFIDIGDIKYITDYDYIDGTVNGVPTNFVKAYRNDSVYSNNNGALICYAEDSDSYDVVINVHGPTPRTYTKTLTSVKPVEFITDRTKEDCDRLRYLNSKPFNELTDEEKEEFLTPSKASFNTADIIRLNNSINNLGYAASVYLDQMRYTTTYPQAERVWNVLIRDLYQVHFTDSLPDTPVSKYYRDYAGTHTSISMEDLNIIEQIFSDIWEIYSTRFKYIVDGSKIRDYADYMSDIDLCVFSSDMPFKAPVTLLNDSIYLELNTYNKTIVTAINELYDAYSNARGYIITD